MKRFLRSSRGLLFCFVLGVYLFTASFRLDSGDGETMYRVAYALAVGQGVHIQPPEEGHTLLIDAQGRTAYVPGVSGYGMYGRGGRFYAKYGLGWSLVAAPLVALARLVGPLFPKMDEALLTRMAALLVNPVVTALGMVVFYDLAQRFYAPRTARFLALGLAFGSPFWYYARSAFSEPLTTLCLLAGLSALLRKRWYWAGFFWGYMLVVRPAAMVMLVPALLWAILWARRSAKARDFWFRLMPPLLLGGAAVLVYNTWRFGNPLDFGYRHVGWDYPLLRGLYGLLLSPGKGLFVFAPALLLGLPGAVLWWRKGGERRRWLLLLWGMSLAQLIFLAKYRHWDGGGGWGPRLLMPIVPLLWLPAGDAWRMARRGFLGRLLLAALLTLSVGIQVLGISVNWARHLQRVHLTSPSLQEYLQRTQFSWRDSPFLGQIRSLQEVAGILLSEEGRMALHGLRTFGANQAEVQQRLSFNVPDFWPVYAFWLRVYPRLWFAVWMGLLVFTLFCGWRLCRTSP